MRLMTFSLADTFDTVAPHIPARLVSPEALALASAVAGHLPASLTKWIYLECRLGEEASRVDMVIEVDECGRAILADQNPVLHLPERIRADPAWGRVRELCRQWADPRSPLHRTVAHIWLEFDVDGRGGGGAPDRPPVPGVFVSLGELPTPDFTAAAWYARALDALRPLMGGGLPSRVAGTLRTCFDGLPAGAYVPYVGVMLSRRIDAVRLCLSGVADDELPRYLRAIGWSAADGELATLASVLGDMRRAAGRGVAILHLDVGETVLPRIGAEYMFERRAQLDGQVLETAFLDHLIERGLCTPAKRDALLAWPGYSYESFRHELWRSLLVRRLNHVKVVYEPGRALEAKGYVCLFYGFHRQRGGGSGDEGRRRVDEVPPSDRAEDVRHGTDPERTDRLAGGRDPGHVGSVSGGARAAPAGPVLVRP